MNGNIAFLLFVRLIKIVPGLQKVNPSTPSVLIAVGIGPNGAGKTTLFNCINAHLPILEGDLVFLCRNLKGLKPHQIAELGNSPDFSGHRCPGPRELPWHPYEIRERLGKATLSAGCS